MRWLISTLGLATAGATALLVVATSGAGQADRVQPRGAQAGHGASGPAKTTTAAAPFAMPRGLPQQGLPAGQPLSAATGYVMTYSPPEGYDVGGHIGALAVGDLTGDRRPEIVVTVSDEAHDWPCRARVYTTSPTGAISFVAEHPLGARCNPYSSGMALGDLNRDGLQDVVMGTNDGIAFLVGDGHGGLRRGNFRVGREILQVGTLDIDLDGRTDVVGLGCCNELGQGNPYGATLFYGDGRGGITFAEPIAAPQRGNNDLEVADINSDGLQDLIIASPSPYFWVMLHAPGPGFLPVRTHSAPGGIWSTDAVTVGDVNTDGRNDLIVNVSANAPEASIVVYRQQPNGLLGSPVRTPVRDLPGPMLAVDLNNDRHTDLAVLHEGWDQVSTRMQVAGGGFGPERLDDMAVDNGVHRQGFAAVDINGDGCPELFHASFNYGLVVGRPENCPARGASLRTGGPLPPRRN